MSSLYHHLSVQLCTLRFNHNELYDRLTQQEQDIIDRVAQGASNREIAAQLYISSDAVKQTLGRIFHKLGVSCRAAAIAKLHRSI
jgi:DNA-binding CsgD family transcriptional regulator